jgi:small subunit ribosomal protein S11
MKKKKNLKSAQINLLLNQNNTIVSLSDKNGNILCWSSAGKEGFKGSTKSTPYAGQTIIEKFYKNYIINFDIKIFDIKIKGFSMARDSILKSLYSTGIMIHSIIENSGLPHNGCRAPKRRRI